MLNKDKDYLKPIFDICGFKQLVILKYLSLLLVTAFQLVIVNHLGIGYLNIFY